jgi:spore maturation protein B
MRPISGTSSLAVLTNIYSLFGPDSSLGILASFIQGSTDTTFYIITLYFGSVGIKKIKYSLWAGLFADLVSIIISILFVNFISLSIIISLLTEVFTI